MKSIEKNKKGTMSIVFKLAQPKKYAFMLFAAFSIILTAINIFPQFILRRIVDVSIPLQDKPSFYYLTGIYLILTSLYIIGSMYLRLSVEKDSIKIVSDLKVRMFSHLTHVNIDYFHKNPVGKLLTRLESDIEQVRVVFYFLLVTILSEICQFLVVLVIIFVVDYRVAVWLLIPVSIMVVLSYLFQKIVQPMIIKVRKKISEITGYAAESISGVRTIQAFRSEPDFKKRFFALSKDRMIKERKSFFTLIYFSRGIEAVAFISNWLVVFLFALLVQARLGVSTGTIIMFTTLLSYALSPLSFIAEQIGEIQKAFASLHRIDDVMNVKREEGVNINTLVKDEESYEEKEKEIQNTLSQNKIIKEGIEFKDVWFAYDDENWVLKGVSFYLPKGKSLAIIGPTGCGKTTMIKLLFNFYKPQKGSIYIDGKDINEFSLHEIRAYMGLVQQENHLFTGNIKDNITLKNDMIKEEEIKKSSELVGSYEFIEKRENGYEAVVNEKGMNYSAGERQLIAFTRCIAYNRPMLILDEATSNIDTNSEKLIQNTITKLLSSHNKTCIIIAHRLSTIMNADEIIVMDSGKIIERGNHKVLIETDGIYKQYFKYQVASDNSKNVAI